MMRRFFVLVLLCLLLIPAATSAQSLDPRVQAAVSDLSQRLGLALTIDDFATWSYAENRYPDTSLGCAAAAGAVAPGSFLAFQVTLVYEGTTFDYRVASDLSRVFPCDANLLAGNPPILVTASPIPLPAGQATFTPVPQPTNPAQSCPSGFVGFLTPRLRVGGQGQIEIGGTPNRLRNNPSSTATQVGTISGGQVMSVIGGPACADGIVWWQVAVGSQVGWTAEGLAPDQYFISPIGEAAPTPVIPPTAGGVPTLAVVRDATTIELYSYDALSRSLALVRTVDVIPVQGDSRLADLQFSPTGVSLLFRQDEQTPQGGYTSNGFEYMLDRGFQLIQAPQVNNALSVTFSEDGGDIVYATLDTQNPIVTAEDDTARQNLIVYERALGLALDGPINPARDLGRITVGISCGGGFPYPGDIVWFNEVGYNGRAFRIALTDYGLLHTGDCAGTTTRLTDLTSGTSIEIGTNLSQAALSPDGQRVAGVVSATEPNNPDRLQIVDLETLESIIIEPADTPQRIAWATDGSGLLYYSTRLFAEPIDITGVPNTPYLGSTTDLVAHITSIYAIDPDTLETQVLLDGGYFWDIGRLLPAPDGNLFFSTIPNGDAWVEALRDGTAATGDGSFEAWVRDYFPVSLWVTNPFLDSPTDVTLLGENMANAALNLASFGAAG
ncbi:MAG: SH3 domain-containing protein [Pleurocapsa minor GSE-CHR-MK-17-07R]|jgi:hypothetical protein|nr:SH3 domain-containing protein [Pleurocapsa minor GSE-CHR-MK 17-07R]